MGKIIRKFTKYIIICFLFFSFSLSAVSCDMLILKTNSSLSNSTIDSKETSIPSGSSLEENIGFTVTLFMEGGIVENNPLIDYEGRLAEYNKRVELLEENLDDLSRKFEEEFGLVEKERTSEYISFEYNGEMDSNYDFKGDGFAGVTISYGSSIAFCDFDIVDNEMWTKFNQYIENLNDFYPFEWMLYNYDIKCDKNNLESLVDELPTPTKGGYEFIGWYFAGDILFNKEGIEKFICEHDWDIICGIGLYAKYAPIEK